MKLLRALLISGCTLHASFAGDLLTESDPTLAKEREKLAPFLEASSPAARTVPFFSAETLERWLAAAGEFTRSNDVDFATAFPQLSSKFGVVYAGPLPLGKKETVQSWAIVRSNLGAGDGSALRIFLTVLPKTDPSAKTNARRSKPATLNSGKLKKFDTKNSVVWWKTEGADFFVYALCQFPPYDSTHPWFHQSVGKFRVRSTGIREVWVKDATLHEINYVPLDRLILPGQTPAPAP